MNAIEEYAERRSKKKEKEIISKFYKAGMSAEEIAKITEIDLKEIEKMLN